MLVMGWRDYPYWGRTGVIGFILGILLVFFILFGNSDTIGKPEQTSVNPENINKNNFLDFGYDYFYLGKDYDDKQGVELANQANKIFILGSPQNTVGRGVQGEIMTDGEITVQGNVLFCAGCHMTGGSVKVSGDAQIAGQNMRGGSVTAGSSSLTVGSAMRGGTITINGNATYVGSAMLGGIIIIEGDAITVGEDMRGGIIIIHGEGKLSPKIMTFSESFDTSPFSPETTKVSIDGKECIQKVNGKYKLTGECKILDS